MTQQTPNSTKTLLMRRKPNPIIIADPDGKFLESLWSDPQASQIPPMVAETSKEAQLILGQFKQSFSGIFVNLELTDPHAISVVRTAHHKQPGVPIFFLSDQDEISDEAGFTAEDIKNLGVQKLIKKPVSYSELLSLVTPAALIFDPSKALETAKQNSDELEREVQAKDGSFFSTRAENFLSGTVSFFDVYIQLSSGRYVKILQAGDSFSAERISNYLNKGVTHFFLRKEAQEHYLNFCDKLVSAIIKSNKVSTRTKISHTLDHGDKTVSFLKNTGLSASSIEYATSFVSNVEQLVQSMNLKKNPELKPFLQDLVSYDHGVSISMIASLLMRELEVENQKAIATVGLASLFHDIGLYSSSIVIQSEDEALMTAADKKNYHDHPLRGAKVLANVRGLDPVVVQIVEQHHERRNRTGFPKQLGPGSILQFSEIIGISDELFKLIQRQKSDPNVDPLVAILGSFDGFSMPVVQAFQNAFMSHAQ